MIVRKIKPEEIKRTDELFSIAFEFPYDNDKCSDEVYADVLAHQDTRGNFYWRERWAAFEDDNKTMMSYFVATPFPVHFDGKKYTMTGIGGVSTLPQYRRSGGIRKCFEAALPDMYKEDVTFSYLYPFSTAYYRKFGYELCCEKIKYQLKMDMLPAFSMEGHCKLISKENNFLKEIKKIDRTWQKKYNLMILNENFEYTWVINSNPCRDQVFTYLYFSKEGEPKGYVTFSKKDDPSGRNLHCSRFVFTDTEGFKGLINLIRSLASDHNYVFFELPSDQYISPLLPEWSMGAGSKSISQCGMVRVINVKRVLENAKYKGRGKLVLQISDPYIPENDQTFSVAFQNSRALSVEPVSQPADISMSINDFSRLITGVCQPEDIAFLDQVKIYGNEKTLPHVFYRKPVFISEYF